MPELIDIFEKEVTCTYRGETYQVRDNGAIFRYARKGHRRRPKDEKWTFGTINKQRGYMSFSSEAVHRIVATAFHGPSPSDKHIVDHIDTNRQNNRPENLRWLTRLENIILNPITLARIIYSYGSIDYFFSNPSEPLNGSLNQNFEWMRTVSKEESENTKKNLLNMGREGRISRRGNLGEWVFSKIYPGEKMNPEEDTFIESQTTGAIQKNWKTPAEFPCCPLEIGNKGLTEYYEHLKEGVVFSRDKFKESIVVSADLSENNNELFVICNHPEGVKEWSLAKVFIEDQNFVHESLGTFFSLDGAKKNLTISLGLKWEGGETFDDLV